MDDYPLVAIVVAVHNNKEDTREFLESLKQVSYSNFKTIIIDDGSTDGTSEMIRQEYPEVVLLEGDGNLWWSGGVNKGIEEAMAIGVSYVLFLDNDTVVDPKFISVLVDTAEKNPNSIISPKVYFYDDPKMIQSAGWQIDRWKVNYTRVGSGEIDQGQYDSQRDIPCATMGTFINTAVFEDIGMMDAKNMPQYGADQDFTIRARQRGYRIIYAPGSMVWHKRKGTVNKGIPTKTSFLSRLIYLTTNPKSQSYFLMQMVFTFRHCPKYLIPLALFRYFLGLAINLKRMV